MSGSPPLRFLAVVLGGYAALRTVFIAPPWPAPHAGAVAAPARSVVLDVPKAFPDVPKVGQGRATARLAEVEGQTAAPSAPPGRAAQRRSSSTRRPSVPAPPSTGAPRMAISTAAASPPLPPSIGLPGNAPASGPGRRWSLSAWSFVRPDGGAPLPAADRLGGSQAGARLAYRINRDSHRPLALSLRLSAPLQRPAGAEAALGLDWRPTARLPIHLLAERRQALGREGRSAFGLTAYGGVSDVAIGHFRIDGYAQAGLVGARSLDPFGDGSIRASIPLGRKFRLGAGAWAAAQPGSARLDIGPTAEMRVTLAGSSAAVRIDWRVRIAGGAQPGGGPALTVASDF